MHIFRPCKKHMQSFKKVGKNCRRICAQKVPTVGGGGGGVGGGAEPRNHGKPNAMSPRFSSKRRGTTNQKCYDRDPAGH